MAERYDYGRHFEPIHICYVAKTFVVILCGNIPNYLDFLLSRRSFIFRDNYSYSGINKIPVRWKQSLNERIRVQKLCLTSIHQDILCIRRPMYMQNSDTNRCSLSCSFACMRVSRVSRLNVLICTEYINYTPVSQRLNFRWATCFLLESCPVCAKAQEPIRDGENLEYMRLISHSWNRTSFLVVNS